jgi:pimeloyl-ACP methyl ester carboxylesterase
MTHDVVQTSSADTLPSFNSKTFWTQFRHGTVKVAGVHLHFVEGGTGSPLLLLPGWPQSWYAWRYVMPLLVAAGRRVIALDPRGMGDSNRPASGYELRTVAAEIHGAVEELGLAAHGPIDVASHDLGTWMGYAYAAEWPRDVNRLAVFDAALPGITPPPPAGIPSAEADVKIWHFAFSRLDDLPEILLQEREREFLTWLFRASRYGPGPSRQRISMSMCGSMRAPARHALLSLIIGTSSAPKASRTATRPPNAELPCQCSPRKPASAPP